MIRKGRATVTGWATDAYHAVASHPALSRAAGRLADARLPAPVLQALIRGFAAAFDVDLSECAEPVAAYETFDAFFTRRLAPGARPIEMSPATVVAPADGVVASIGAVSTDVTLEQIKGRSFRLSELLGDQDEARRFEGGAYATLYLSPRDYHRVHSPVDGSLVRYRHIPGRRLPVNARAARRVDNLYATNERVVISIESADFGPVAVVMVGAANVGRISLSHGQPRPDRRTLALPMVAVRRGTELGAFHLGSTVVLIVGASSLMAASEARDGGTIRVGRPLLITG